MVVNPRHFVRDIIFWWFFISNVFLAFFIEYKQLKQKSIKTQLVLTKNTNDKGSHNYKIVFEDDFQITRMSKMSIAPINKF